MKRRGSELALLALLLLCPGARARAKELDQFTDRRQVLAFYAGGYRSLAGAPSPAQVDAVLDARMNELLDALAHALQRDPPRTAKEREQYVRDAFQHRLLPELITPYEEWAKHEAPVPLYKVRDKGIYGNAVDYDDMRMTWYIELSPILQVSSVLIGLDKLGHFLGQGFQYYEFERNLPRSLSAAERAQRVREYGHDSELGQLGVATGGVYSVADLASNWSGMLFFMALFEDVQLEGEAHARFFAPAANGGYRRLRDFHWAEWITADWDEALNPAHTQQRALFDKVVESFKRPTGAPGSRAPSICDQYRADPASYLGPARRWARGKYALPERAAAVAPHVIDVRAICGPR